ncbi:parB-like partition protein [Alkaliphilus metalliredigens QYMF]|uniref:ParB-like partition protein n=1 Tax=Alkaliphilus metalliredigens (strain QYMF) TaxID=293826 RepID=A6TXD9_ALKMQ|nr:ParB/RepB/Spo0J family partition protein [Alkaliphilus metalliredigens]ABR50857.1 parB-like partition protein [Alkaliphilus metalliredigens QYMF]
MTKLKKRGLGRGLEALIPDMIIMEASHDEKQVEKLQLISIEEISPNEDQPRKTFDETALEELAKSIERHGMIQPIIVSKEKRGYQIIAGERRWRAARKIQLKEVPCIIREYSRRQLLEIALIENLQRENLSIIEEAKAYKYLIDEYDVTQDQLAEALGKSRPHITNMLRLLQLDERIIDMIQGERITGGHGRALLSIKDSERQYQIALKVESERLNVRQVEGLVKALLENQKEKKKKKQEKDLIIVEIEDNLKKLFGTKVSIVKGQKKGKIEIEYYNDEDLERILEMLN